MPHTTTQLPFIRDAIKTAHWEARAMEIEEMLDDLCDHISPPGSMNLTEADVRYNRLHRELCDTYQTLFLRYKSLVK